MLDALCFMLSITEPEIIIPTPLSEVRNTHLRSHVFILISSHPITTTNLKHNEKDLNLFRVLRTL